MNLAIVMLLALVVGGCADRRLAGTGGGGGDEETTENLTTNLYALHDSSSDQYRDDCLSCHSDILTEESLDGSVPTAHNAMLPNTPGETTQSKCVYCHTTVDLMQRSAGNIRRQVSVTTCDLCHGPDGPSTRQYYQE